MNRGDLIAKIVKETGVSKRQASNMVAATVAAITKALKKGEAVTLTGFGTFRMAQRKARRGHNPLTGAAITIPRRKAVRFAAGKGLRSAIN
jgi:DNA-binding protein HU-beta